MVQLMLLLNFCDACVWVKWSRCKGMHFLQNTSTYIFVGVNVFLVFAIVSLYTMLCYNERAITGPHCMCSNDVSNRIKPFDTIKSNWPLNIWLVLSWLKYIVTQYLFRI